MPRWLLFALMSIFTLPCHSLWAQQPNKPMGTLQVKPLGSLLVVARAVAETIQGKEAANRITDAITEKFGEKGLLGIELTKPILGTVPKLAEMGEDQKFLLMIPITTEKEFLALLSRADVSIEAHPDFKGLYTVELPDELAAINVTVYLRIMEGYAYFGVAFDPEELNQDKLPLATKIYDPKVTDTLFTRFSMKLLPKNYMEVQQANLERTFSLLTQLPLPEKLRDAVDGLSKSLVDWNEMIFKDGDEQTLALNLDPAKSEVSFTLGYTAKLGSELDKRFRELKPNESRFASLVNEQTAAAAFVRLPLFHKSLQAVATAGLDEILKQVENGTKPIVPFYKELIEAEKRAVKKGQVAWAATLQETGTTGKYTLNAGLTCEDTTKIEAEFRELPKKSEEFDKERLILDAFKVGTVNVHQFNVYKDLPAEWRVLMAKDSVAYLAFAPDAIHISFGGEAKTEITRMIQSKTGKSSPLSLIVNGDRVKRLLEKVPDVPENLLEVLPKKDSPTRLFELAIDNTNGLSTKIHVNLNVIVGLGAAKPR